MICWTRSYSKNEVEPLCRYSSPPDTSGWTRKLGVVVLGFSKFMKHMSQITFRVDHRLNIMIQIIQSIWSSQERPRAVGEPSSSMCRTPFQFKKANIWGIFRTPLRMQTKPKFPECYTYWISYKSPLFFPASTRPSGPTTSPSTRTASRNPNSPLPSLTKARSNARIPRFE